MADVLQFPGDLSRNKRRTGAMDGDQAADKSGSGPMGQIVIFPGVRIERKQCTDLDLSHRLVRVSGPVEGASGSPAGKF